MNKMANKTILIPILSIIFLLTTFGCESPLRKSGQSISLAKESQRANEKVDYLASAQQYLKLSETTAPPENHEYTIMAADMFVKAGQPAQSRALLDKVSDSELDVNQKIYKQIVRSELALANRNPNEAFRLLQDIRITSDVPSNTRSRILYLQARSYEDNHQYLNAARTRSELDQLLVDQQSQFINRQSIQHNLAKLSTDALNQAAHRESYPFSGWLSLAYIEKSYRSPAEKSQAIQEWQQHYANHPAQALLQQHQAPSSAPTYAAQQSNVHKIALLLPMNGPHAKAAKSIREGFLAAHYESGSSISKPSIQVYDTSTSQDVLQTYQRAVQEGADFIVGPLVKEDVVRLSQMPSYSLKTPILALNEHPQVNSSTRSFIQFSLSPENEADQITEKAKSLGYRNASIVVPNNAWGKRLAARFKTNWQRIGGKIVSEAQIDPHKDLSKQMQKFLSLEQSQSRSSAIKQIVKESVDYQLRRRNDVDVVFMALPPELARQVKPLFDFYFANDIPILATSSVYAGSPNPKRDRDMNGIQFVDMPWLVDSRQNRHAKSRQEGHASGEATRLFAMGVDAYEITLKFNQLQRSPNSSVSGATGRLTLTPDNRIKRHLSWAKISNGTPVLVQ